MRLLGRPATTAADAGPLRSDADVVLAGTLVGGSVLLAAGPWSRALRRSA